MLTKLSRNVTGLEFHQHIDVAVGAEVIAEYGSEQCEPRDVVPLAEHSDGIAVDGQVRAHVASMIPPSNVHADDARLVNLSRCT